MNSIKWSWADIRNSFDEAWSTPNTIFSPVYDATRRELENILRWTIPPALTEALDEINTETTQI